MTHQATPSVPWFERSLRVQLSLDEVKTILAHSATAIRSGAPSSAVIVRVVGQPEIGPANPTFLLRDIDGVGSVWYWMRVDEPTGYADYCLFAVGMGVGVAQVTKPESVAEVLHVIGSYLNNPLIGRKLTVSGMKSHVVDAQTVELR